MAEKYLKQYEIFLRKAISDLKSAKILLRDFNNGERELDIEIVFFHLQQAAEKLIKSLLSFNEIDSPKSHDIKLLIALLNDNNIDLPDAVEKLIPLTDYAVEGRYSIINDEIADVDKSIEILDNFVLFVSKIIN